MIVIATILHAVDFESQKSKWAHSRAPSRIMTEPAKSSPSRAILWMCLAISIFSLQDAFVKFVSGAYPIHQVLFIRCAVALPILVFFAGISCGITRIFQGNVRLLMMRGVILIGSYGAYYSSLPALKLADALALNSTSVLFVSLFTAIFLGERVTPARAAAIALGFVGVLIMLRPGSGVFEPASLLPVFAAIAYATGQTIVRRIGLSEPAPVIAFHQNLVFLIAASVLGTAVHLGLQIQSEHPTISFIFRDWRVPTTMDFLLMAACGPIAAIGNTMLSNAYRTAQASLVAPFEYTWLLWAGLWGFLIWGDVPGLWTYVGAALIAGSGIFLMIVAGRVQRQRTAAYPGEPVRSPHRSDQST